MSLHAGIDEAGYGPTLGPLVIAVACFESLRPEAKADWEALAPLVQKAKKGGRDALWVDDSKLIKSAKNGLERLEAGVLCFLAAAGQRPESVGELLSAVGVDAASLEGLPWYETLLERPLPIRGWRGDLLEKGRRLSRSLDAAGLRFRGFRAAPVSARRFNELVQETDNKATTLLRALTPLIRSAHELSPAEGLLRIDCDRLGGRQRYGPVIGQVFPRCQINILEQERACSRYRVRVGEREILMSFRTKADRDLLPVALASMLCKYLREVFMDSLNEFFRARLPELAPTAGYPQDAVRYLVAIDPLVPSLGVPRDWLVRSR